MSLAVGEAAGTIEMPPAAVEVLAAVSSFPGDDADIGAGAGTVCWAHTIQHNFPKQRGAPTWSVNNTCLQHGSSPDVLNDADAMPPFNPPFKMDVPGDGDGVGAAVPTTGDGVGVSQ
jgi:hypothetical protein